MACVADTRCLPKTQPEEAGLHYLHWGVVDHVHRSVDVRVAQVGRGRSHGVLLRPADQLEAGRGRQVGGGGRRQAAGGARQGLQPDLRSGSVHTMWNVLERGAAAGEARRDEGSNNPGQCSGNWAKGRSQLARMDTENTKMDRERLPSAHWRSTRWQSHESYASLVCPAFIVQWLSASIGKPA